MNRRIIGKRVLILSTCLAMFLVNSSEALAAERVTARDILRTAGASTLIVDNRTVEEYIAFAEEAKGSNWGYTNLGLCSVSDGNLNIRETAGSDGKVVGALPKDAACEVHEIKDGWAKITSGEVEGYVSAEYLHTGPDAVLMAAKLVKTVARVTRNGVNVRDAASLDGGILTQVPENEELEYIGTMGEWVQVSIDGNEAYIAAEYVEIETKLSTAITLSELLYGEGVSDVRVELVEYAKQFLGNPYVWGGTSLTKGADCSGFVQSVFKNYGIQLSRTSREQAKNGTKIKSSELQPGDLIFYANSSGTINHVAIYIGNSQVIHASSPKSGIKISTYNYRTPVRYVRVIAE